MILRPTYKGKWLRRGVNHFLKSATRFMRFLLVNEGAKSRGLMW